MPSPPCPAVRRPRSWPMRSNTATRSNGRSGLLRGGGAARPRCSCRRPLPHARRFRAAAGQILPELMRVVWTRAALEGLETITDYVAQHNLAAALRLVDDIPERTNALLADDPMIGRVGRVADTRELVLSGTPYIVAYQVSDQVDVLAVMHGARQWPEDFGAP